MAVKITAMYTKSLPALRFIGKPCLCDPKEFIAKWDEWLVNGWFDQLEKLGLSPENGDQYLGFTDKNECYRIGLLFPPETTVPEGFDSVDIPAAKYAVANFEGKKDKELLSEDGVSLIINEIQERDLTPAPHGWCIERYNRSFDVVGKDKILLECFFEIQ